MATEKRLIDEFKNEIMKEFITRCNGNDYNKLTLLRIGETIDRIYEKYRTLPTVDAEEVVRCKECKHWHEETGWCYHHSHLMDSNGAACHPWESPDWKMLNANEFCSYGERKDND